MTYSNTLEEAISKGEHFFLEEDFLSEGRSGGTICPKCRKWTSLPKKRKNPHPHWINDCESCAIADPFRRMWHKFNRECDDHEREMHNEWLREVKHLSNELKYSSELGSKHQKKLHELLSNIPFFEGAK